jgi:hypothetical protein
MKKIDEVLRQLSRLYEFNKKMQSYEWKKRETQAKQVDEEKK